MLVVYFRLLAMLYMLVGLVSFTFPSMTPKKICFTFDMEVARQRMNAGIHPAIPNGIPEMEYRPNADGHELDLTVQNVDKVLDDIRPYLIADGGNVEVLSVNLDDRSINLSLIGACSTCSSSTATMKEGIEKKLKEFFNNLGPVSAVETVLEVAPPALTKEYVEESLDQVMPAVKQLGGTLTVDRVEAINGTVYLNFMGPPRLQKGIELILMDNALIRHVIINTEQ